MKQRILAAYGLSEDDLPDDGYLAAKREADVERAAFVERLRSETERIERITAELTVRFGFDPSVEWVTYQHSPETVTSC
jgi:hypothetical protein